jgi:hypothetical protein
MPAARWDVGANLRATPIPTTGAVDSREHQSRRRVVL